MHCTTSLDKCRNLIAIIKQSKIILILIISHSVGLDLFEASKVDTQ